MNDTEIRDYITKSLNKHSRPLITAMFNGMAVTKLRAFIRAEKRRLAEKGVEMYLMRGHSKFNASLFRGYAIMVYMQAKVNETYLDITANLARARERRNAPIAEPAEPAEPVEPVEPAEPALTTDDIFVSCDVKDARYKEHYTNVDVFPCRGVDPAYYLEIIKGPVTSTIRAEQQSRVGHALKFNIFIKAVMTDGVDDEVMQFWQGHPKVILQANDVTEAYDEAVDTILEHLAGHNHGTGSGKTIKELISCTLELITFPGMQGGTYIPTPAWIKSQNRCLVNVKNDDNECIRWAILAYLHPADTNPQRLTKYTPFKDELVFPGIAFPVQASDVWKVEQANQININLFIADNHNRVIYNYGRKKGIDFPGRPTVDLLLISNSVTHHYVTIKPGMLGSLINQCRTDNASFPCTKCMQTWSREEGYKRHLPYCMGVEHPTQVAVFPKEGSYKEFSRLNRTIRAPLVCYADLETMTTRKFEGPQKDGNVSWTQKEAIHQAYSIAYQAVSEIPEVPDEFKMHAWDPNKGGRLIFDKFFEDLHNLADRANAATATPKDMIFTEEDAIAFRNSKTCACCNEPFSDEDNNSEVMHTMQTVYATHSKTVVPPKSGAASGDYLRYIKMTVREKAQIKKALKAEKKLAEAEKAEAAPATPVRNDLDDIDNLLDELEESFADKAQTVNDGAHATEPFIGPQKASTLYELRGEKGKETVVYIGPGPNAAPAARPEVAPAKRTWLPKPPKRSLTEEGMKKKVRDHCHITGKYRAALHAGCNLKVQPTWYDRKNRKLLIYVVFHNLRGFDGHYIIKQYQKKYGNTITCIPNNREKFMCFQIGQFMFIDSMQHYLASLESLVSTMSDKGMKADDFHYCREAFGDNTNLLLKKGVFPYDYINYERLQETQLPPIEAFTNRLNGQKISQADYEHAQEVWKAFDCKTLMDYHDVYLKGDVLQLTDIFERHRKLTMGTYGLDAAHYVSAPGIAGDAMLKLSNTRLELISDPTIHAFFQKSIRGGISMISKRYAAANNKYMPDFDPSEPSSYIEYLDATNLYGYAMSQYLPTGNFQWLTDTEIAAVDAEFIMNIADDSPTGYVFEVDVEYPAELHDAHSDYPLLVESKVIGEDPAFTPSPFSLNQKIAMGKHKVGRRYRETTRKLVPNLYNKSRYVVHYRMLKLALELGLKITKVHAAISFDQSPWLKNYIDLNTNLRREAKDEFAKNFYKLMNNAAYGKTLENLYKRTDIRLETDDRRIDKLKSSPACKHIHAINDDLYAIHMAKTKIFLNTPVYVGFCVLELSKWWMYTFYYKVLKHQFGDRMKLLMTDTDSLCIHVRSPDIYEELKPYQDEWFDTNKFPKDHPFYSTVNNGVLGMFKPEYEGGVITEFAGHKPKMYALEYLKWRSTNDQKQSTKKAKGVSKGVVKGFNFDQYKSVIMNPTSVIHAQFTSFRSYNHDLHIQTANKSALCSDDTKRYVLEDGINTLAYGHYSIAMNA